MAIASRDKKDLEGQLRLLAFDMKKIKQAD
jgi:hypothetical protein